MKPTVSYLAAFLATAVAGATLSVAGGASAWWVRSHASKCMTLGGAPLDTAFSVQNDSTASNMVVLCPATDTDTEPKQATVAMNVHGYDDSTVANADTLACRSTWSAPGGACQTGPSSSGLGTFNLTVPTTTVWAAATAADFGYVYVNLPAKQGTAFRSSLRGTFQSN